MLAGQTWGRVVGITLAVLSALANFAFLPYYPFWAMTTIALDIFVMLGAGGPRTRAHDLTDRHAQSGRAGEAPSPTSRTGPRV